MNALLNRLQDFEARYERLVVREQQLERQVANLANQIQQVQGQSGGGGQIGGGAGIYEITAANAVVISAGGSATGVTVSQRFGSGISTSTTTGTVYNDMQQPTVTGKTILLGVNPDGSFLVITQSC